MKLTKYLAGFAAFAFAATSHADVTVNVTGATAFRAASLLSIKAQYVASGLPFKFAHDQAAGGTTFSGATRAIFIGTFPGVTGTTTIRCCFTGSVEGVRALVLPSASDPSAPTYYQPSLLSGTTAITGGAELASQATNTAAVLGAISDIAFSDVKKEITPFASAAMGPADPAAGVIVFTMLTNKGSSLTNVTSQQFRALLTNGHQPRSLFTGIATDTDLVFATGRNDGSGTRTVYLAESGYGVTNQVNQYVTNATSGTTITQIQRVPAGGVNSPSLPGQSAANASTVWGQDVNGNGGYSSGSTLRGDMARTTASVTVLDAAGSAIYTNIPLSLVTWLSLNDAVTARGAGNAVLCAYNGVKLDGIAASGTVMTATDKAKITNGLYTAWSYEEMYLRGDVTDGDKQTVYDTIKSGIPTNLGAAGIALSDMAVGRGDDGGTVAP